MTLIIAGHYERQHFLKERGIFFATDSIITSNEIPLLGGFRKIYPVAIKLWKPYFIDSSFKSYPYTHIECQCAIAFSGNTLWPD